MNIPIRYETPVSATTAQSLRRIPTKDSSRNNPYHYPTMSSTTQALLNKNSKAVIKHIKGADFQVKFKHQGRNIKSAKAVNQQVDSRRKTSSRKSRNNQNDQLSKVSVKRPISAFRNAASSLSHQVSAINQKPFRPDSVSQMNQWNYMETQRC